MRPIEILLSLTNLLTFFVVAVPRLHAVRWTGYMALIALLLAVTQIAVEGPRWQMLPAYVLTGLFTLVWLQNMVPLNRPVGQILNNRVTINLAIVLCVFGLVVSIALPIALPVFRIPHPNGPYAIGTLTYHWVDTSRPEIFAADPHARRELIVQIWYPTQGMPASPRAPYVQDADALTSTLARLLHMPTFTFAHWKYVTTNAVPSAPVADDQPTYPVLIFLEGANGFRQMNTFQVRNSSHTATSSQPSTSHIPPHWSFSQMDTRQLRCHSTR